MSVTVNKGGKLYARIMIRDTPCKCGCKGNDSWHRRFYVRRLWNIMHYVVPTIRTNEEGFRFCETAMARVRFPWGHETVFHHEVIKRDGSSLDLGWHRKEGYDE